MDFPIKRRTPPPRAPLNGTNFHPFLPHFFSFAIESYLYETDFTIGFSKNITFKSSYNWFKLDILRLGRLLTAIFSPVQGHLNYYTHI